MTPTLTPNYAASGSVATERARAIAAEGTLTTAVSTETTRATTAEGLLAPKTTVPTTAPSPSGDTTGATDTPLIQALLTAGGLTKLRDAPESAPYWVTKLTIPTGSHLAGTGVNTTYVKLAAAQNSNVIETTNFSTLVGTDTSASPHNLGWSDLTVDGNASGQSNLASSSTAAITHGTPNLSDTSAPFTSANVGDLIRLQGAGVGGAALVTSILTFTNSSNVVLAINASTDVSGAISHWGKGCGIAAYAYAITARNYRIKNCKSWGLWTEWALQSSWLTPDGMDSLMEQYMIHDNGEGGHYNAGPHDLQCEQFHIVRNGPGTGTKTPQLYVAVANKANGASFDHFHIWGGTSDYGASVSASGVTFGPDTQIEGGLVAQVNYENGSNNIRGRLFSGNVNSTTTKGIVFGGNSPGAIVGDVTIEDCGGACVDFTNAGGNHHLMIRGRYSATPAPASPVVGTPSNSRIDTFVINNDFTVNTASESGTSGILRAGGSLGSVTSGRFVGATNGIPTTGTWKVKDWAVDSSTTGGMWICMTAGTPGNWVFISGSLAASWTPADQNWITWAYDPVSCTSQSILATGGTVYCTRLKLPYAQNITNIVLFLQAGGTSLVSGQCFAALYQGGGTGATLLGTTASQHTNWQGAAGVQTMAISGGAVAAAAGDLNVAFWANTSAGTLPTFGRGGGQQTLLNANHTRFTTANTGVTTATPSPLGTVAQTFTSYWAALS